jgi:twitching motility protein PilI
MSQEAAFQALVELARLSQQHAKALPAQVNASPRWSGIGFSLLNYRFVLPLGQIAEMLEIPASTRLPGVQPWVIGLANVRGRLLPLFDMPQLLGGKATGHRKQHRVLVIDTNNYYSGLIVDQAYGMQHFTSERYSEEVSDVPEAVQSLVQGAYTDAVGNTWAVMHIPSLLQDPRFANAALG